MLPRFSIRTALLGVTAMSGFSLVLAQAVRGQQWAAACAAGVVFLLVALPVYAVTYNLVRLTGAVLLQHRSLPKGVSPLRAKEADEG